MPNIAGTTYQTSVPSLVQDGYGSGMPRIFYMESSALTSDISSTGFIKAAGDGGRNPNPGLRLGDIVLARQTTTTAKPGFLSTHSVIASSANVASTIASSAFTASMGYDITLSACT